MKSSAERNDFSTRLKSALTEASFPSDSPTQLSREFNSRFRGRPITIHAARKWLYGESIPTQEKIRTLAEWLQVPSDWLRYGDAPKNDKNILGLSTPFISSDVRLITELQSLDPHYQTIAREFIRLLIRVKGS